MAKYPAARYAVIAGELKSETINGPGEERAGWEPTPHRFRPITVQEYILQGHSPEEANRLHARELRRVQAIFAGHSLEEAETIADIEPGPEVGSDGEVEALRAKVAALTAELEQKQAEREHIIAKFNENWAKLTAERDDLKKKLTGRKRAADPAAEPTVSE